MIRHIMSSKFNSLNCMIESITFKYWNSSCNSMTRFDNNTCCSTSWKQRQDSWIHDGQVLNIKILKQDLWHVAFLLLCSKRRIWNKNRQIFITGVVFNQMSPNVFHMLVGFNFSSLDGIMKISIKSLCVSFITVIFF